MPLVRDRYLPRHYEVSPEQEGHRALSLVRKEGESEENTEADTKGNEGNQINPHPMQERR